MREHLSILITLLLNEGCSSRKYQKGRITTTTKDVRPFYPDPFFSISEPNMKKYQTAMYGDYRYLDINYEYTINFDFYRYGATEAADYNQDPARISKFGNTKTLIDRYWKHYKYYYRITITDPAEEKIAYNEFKKNIRRFEKMSESMPSAVFRINPYTHINFSTFQKEHLGFDNSDEKVEYIESYSADIDNIPAELDWSVVGGRKTPPPNSQEGCSISHVYSAIHNIELKMLTESGKEADDMKRLSVQQGHDCALPRRTCGDSRGGKPHFVFKGFKQRKIMGIHEINKQFISDTWTNLSCLWHDQQNTSNASVVAKVVDWGLISVQNEEELLLALNEYGPLSTAIYVTEKMKHYYSGVLTPEDCGTKEANHAVLLVGYGETKGKERIPYWILKNSWGANWGDNGFFFLERNKAACGIGGYLAYVEVRDARTTTTTAVPTTEATTTPPCDYRMDVC